MNYQDKIKQANAEADAVIHGITSQLNEENRVYEFMWKEGVINDMEVYAIKLTAWINESYIPSITNGTNTRFISSLLSEDKAELADIIMQDKKYRVMNNFGITRPDDMSLVYGDNWFDMTTLEGIMIDEAHCQEVPEQRFINILRGCGVHYEPGETIITYHDVTFRNGLVMQCISVIRI